ncbi:MAG: hypothetical protein QCI38_00695 [Candidatus Thermoplasmatota archaeon]|nr:hypothetical protein [Candidatus Thermoplasmatota archaeon]
MEKKRLLSILFSVIGTAILVVSIFVPWAAIDGDINISIMTFDVVVDMDAKFYPYGMDFLANATVSSQGGGVGGGLLGGGMLGGGGASTEIGDSVLYVDGIGGLSSLAGGALGIYLYKIQDPVNYTIPVVTQGTGSAKLDVTLDRQTPVWWPAGVEQTFVLKVRANSLSQIDYVRVDNVRFYLYTEYNETKTSGSSFSLVPFDVVHSTDLPVSVNLSRVGDNWEYEYTITISEFHERFGVGAAIAYTAMDTGGVSTTGNSYGSGTRDYPWASQQIQISQGQAAQVMLLGLALPVLIVAIILGGAAALLSSRKHSKTRYLLLSVGILSILSSVFFFLGPGVIVDLVPLLENLLQWTPFIFLPVAASAFFFVACAFEWREEEEEMVAFEVEEEEEGGGAVTEEEKEKESDGAVESGQWSAEQESVYDQ